MLVSDEHPDPIPKQLEKGSHRRSAVYSQNSRWTAQGTISSKLYVPCSRRRQWDNKECQGPTPRKFEMKIIEAVHCISKILGHNRKIGKIKAEQLKKIKRTRITKKQKKTFVMCEGLLLNISYTSQSHAAFGIRFELQSNLVITK